MNPFNTFKSHPRRRQLRSACLADTQPSLGSIRFEWDLALENLSAILTSIAASVLTKAPWLHEDVPTLIHHPGDIALTMSWVSILLLGSLAARIAARTLRQQRAVSRDKNTARVD
jgi:hypothetical protein